MPPVQLADNEIFVEVTSTVKVVPLTGDRPSGGSKRTTLERPLTAQTTPSAPASATTPVSEHTTGALPDPHSGFSQFPTQSPAIQRTGSPPSELSSSQPAISSFYRTSEPFGETPTPRMPPLLVIPESPARGGVETEPASTKGPTAGAGALLPAGVPAPNSSGSAVAGMDPAVLTTSPRTAAATEAADPAVVSAVSSEVLNLAASLSVWETPQPPRSASSDGAPLHPASTPVPTSPNPPATTSPSCGLACNTDAWTQTSASPPATDDPKASTPQSDKLFPLVQAEQPTLRFRPAGAEPDGPISLCAITERCAAFLVEDADGWAAVAACPAADKGAAEPPDCLPGKPSDIPCSPAESCPHGTGRALEFRERHGALPQALPGLGPGASTVTASSTATSVCTGAASETCGSSAADSSIVATPTSGATASTNRPLASCGGAGPDLDLRSGARWQPGCPVPSPIASPAPCTLEALSVAKTRSPQAGGRQGGGRVSSGAAAAAGAAPSPGGRGGPTSAAAGRRPSATPRSGAGVGPLAAPSPWRHGSGAGFGGAGSSVGGSVTARQSPAGAAYGSRFVPLYGGASVGPGVIGGRRTPPPVYSSASTRLALHDVLSRRTTRSRGAGGGASISFGANQLVDIDFRPRWRY